MEFGIVVAPNVAWAVFSSAFDCYHDDECIDGDGSLRRRRFFFLAVKLSWPLSVFESSLSESSLDELEPELDDDDELELLELSDAKPVLSFRLTRSASSAKAGSFSYKETILNTSVSRNFNFNPLPWVSVTTF